MISAHEKIVHHLITTVSIPDRADHVKVLVSELQRISILWDELWFNSIQQYSTEGKSLFLHFLRICFKYQVFELKPVLVLWQKCKEIKLQISLLS